MGSKVKLHRPSPPSDYDKTLRQINVVCPLVAVAALTEDVYTSMIASR